MLVRAVTAVQIIQAHLMKDKKKILWGNANYPLKI